MVALLEPEIEHQYNNELEYKSNETNYENPRYPFKDDNNMYEIFCIGFFHQVCFLHFMFIKLTIIHSGY